MRRFGIIIISLLLCGAFAAAGKPTLTPFLADSASNTGIAIVVCPGGSYSWLDMKTEGVGVAEWLQSQGINAFVLRYHVANVSAYMFGYRVLGLGNHYPKMLNDVEWALRQVYDMADSLHIDTMRVGVMIRITGRAANRISSARCILSSRSRTPATCISVRAAAPWECGGNGNKRCGIVCLSSGISLLLVHRSFS